MKKTSLLFAIGAVASFSVMAKNNIDKQNLYETPIVDKFYDACNVVEEMGLVSSTAYRIVQYELDVIQTCGRVNYTNTIGNERASLIVSADAGKYGSWNKVTLAMNTNKKERDNMAFIPFREAAYRLIAGQVNTNEKRKAIYDVMFKPEFYEQIKDGAYDSSLSFYDLTNAKITYQPNNDGGHILTLFMTKQEEETTRPQTKK